MRRITLALALMGAVAAAGCGKTATSNNGGNPGVGEATFKVTIQNGQDGNTSLAITGGYVVSTPAGIDCGKAGHGACTAEFGEETSVTLTAVPDAGVNFWGFAGDCYTANNSCTISASAAAPRNADTYIVARFGVGVPPDGHPNWNPEADHGAAHGSQALAYLVGETTPEIPVATTRMPLSGAWQCGQCHGAALTGAGLAPGCNQCHPGSSTVNVRTGSTAPGTVSGERCRTCHTGQGAIHQATYTAYADAPKLAATIVSVATVTSAGATTTTATFKLTKNGTPYSVDPAKLAQKTIYAARYDSATRSFPASFSMSGMKETSTKGTYTAFKGGTGSAAPAFAPETSNAFVYMYFAENPTLIPANGNYRLYDDVASIAVEYGNVDTFVSAANVASCENCHGAPYMKHGYRAGAVSGIPDMVACKACHYDTRTGSHLDWQCLVETPDAYAAGTCAAQTAYGDNAYKASTMNDTHMSHAMEFPYPQAMSTCVTCHSGKLVSSDLAVAAGVTRTQYVLNDAQMTWDRCKSCHPVTRDTVTYPVDGERAPPLQGPGGVMAGHSVDLSNGLVRAYPNTTGPGTEPCAWCHSDDQADGFVPNTKGGTLDGKGPSMFGGEQVPLFREFHTGLNPQIYAANGAKLADSITTSISNVAVAGGTTLTFDLAVAGLPAGSIVNPFVAISLYGYTTKDFVVSSHSTHADGKRNLETAAGDAAHPRLTFDGAPSAGKTTFSVTASLSSWASKLNIAGGNSVITRAQIGVMPQVGVVPTAAVGTTNPMIALSGATTMVDLTSAATSSGLNLVDPAKCNKCHDRLATTFHNPNYGSAGVIGCRLCHTPASGGSHLEMQSRSIDSYVHAIHSFQVFDPGDIDFTDPVEALKYEHHIASQYPNFTTLSCESCHVSGPVTKGSGESQLAYEPPRRAADALPAVLSASDPVTGREIGGVLTTVTGPAAKACGGCHRAYFINQDDGAGLNAYDDHTAAFGYRETVGNANYPSTTSSTTLWDAVRLMIYGKN